MYRTHEQTFNALSGYPDIETIDMSKVTHGADGWKNGQRELKMTLPPMTCWVHNPEDKGYVVISLAVDEELHSTAVGKLNALLAKALETKSYAADSLLIRPAPKEGQRPNIVMYVNRNKFEAMCASSRVRSRDVIGCASIVSVKTAIGRAAKLESPRFELFPHEINFLKTYKSKRDTRDADSILGVLDSVEDDEIEVKATRIPAKRAGVPKKTAPQKKPAPVEK